MSEDIIGQIVDGKVTNVKHFGAFVKLESGVEGLVHISEIANEYIKDINDYVASGDDVRVKVLARNEKNQIQLSIKQAAEGEG